MKATLAELDWVAAHGFKVIEVPGTTFEPGLPPLHDAYFEPFWSKCVELGLVLDAHAGWGMKQGTLAALVRRFFEQTQGAGEGMVEGQAHVDASMMDAQAASEALSTAPDSPFRLDVAPRRVLWQLMLGGVFDRHPELQLVITENRADWLPPTLRHLDARFEKGDTPLRQRPSEYWDQHGWVTPSAVHTCEIEMRHEIGMHKMLFGTDYPHPEATWPNTQDWIRHNFTTVPEDEARQILGERAIKLFGFDRRVLTEIAERIGPTPQQILGHFELDPRLIDALHARAGMSRGPDPVDTNLIDNLVDEDLSALATL
jgi:predicted TIM-barrel fold metal-dependent hydrolase